MLVSVFLALFLPCVGMSAVFLVYICLLWYAAAYQSSSAAATSGGGGDQNDPVKQNQVLGLSAAQLDKLPKITGKELVMGNDCAVCLDEIENEQIARVVPGCNHGFHVECADTWLSKNPVCPVCRTKLEPDFFNPPESNPC